MYMYMHTIEILADFNMVVERHTTGIGESACSGTPIVACKTSVLIPNVQEWVSSFGCS